MVLDKTWLLHVHVYDFFIFILKLKEDVFSEFFGLYHIIEHGGTIIIWITSSVSLL